MSDKILFRSIELKIVRSNGTPFTFTIDEVAFEKYLVLYKNKEDAMMRIQEDLNGFFAWVTEELLSLEHN